MKDCIDKSGNTLAKAVVKCAIDNHCFDKVEKKKEIEEQIEEKIEEKVVEIIEELIEEFVPNTDPEKCMHEHCEKEWNACDQACQAALKKCTDKCGKNPLCLKPCIDNCGNSNAKNFAGCAQKYHCYG